MLNRADANIPNVTILRGPSLSPASYTLRAWYKRSAMTPWIAETTGWFEAVLAHVALIAARLSRYLGERDYRFVE
jgi:hypothetical protein